MQTRRMAALGAGLVALGTGWIAWQGEADSPATSANAVGLQAGANVPAFDVKTITGQLKDKTLCYV